VNTHLAEAVSGGYDLADTGVVSHVAFFPQGDVGLMLELGGSPLTLGGAGVWIYA
jgi:hypothetical protein